MRARLSALLLLVPALVPFSSPLRAATWQQPTPDELKMTADPASPNAPAIYLDREESTDNHLHMQYTYVRVKILRDEAKNMGDVEIRGLTGDYQITDVQGRTIHADGKVIPFTGKPYQKMLVKAGNEQYRAVVFSLPDVQTGSILEYSYKLRYPDNRVLTPTWDVQDRLYTRKAHFHFLPTDELVISDTDKGGATSSLAYSNYLPPGAKIAFEHAAYDLGVTNVPGIPHEEFEPPMDSLAYRVRFYYTTKTSAAQYWNQYGKGWSKQVDRFAAGSPEVTKTAAEWSAGAASEPEKLEKIYDALTKLENTRYTRERSSDENRAEGVKRVKTADDVLALKRGDPEQIALLFLALARAAGFKAYAMQVVNRNSAFFQEAYLSPSQFDDTVIIVSVHGKEMYFDPGERYATFGKLHWRHSDVTGLRQNEGGGTGIASTPPQSYRDNLVQRMADLKLQPDGSVEGSVTLICIGTRALELRHRALSGDEAQLKQELDHEMASDLPSGLLLHTDHFLALDTQGSNLIVRMTVSGSLGTGTGKRLFVPLSVFSAGGHNPFTSSHRETVIDMHYPSYEKDEVVLHVPAGMTIETVPDKTKVELPGMAVYLSTVTRDGQTITYKRDFAMANAIYKPTEYDKLKDFLNEVSNKDREQAVLQAGAPAGQ